MIALVTMNADQARAVEWALRDAAERGGVAFTRTRPLGQLLADYENNKRRGRLTVAMLRLFFG